MRREGGGVRVLMERGMVVNGVQGTERERGRDLNVELEEVEETGGAC